MLSRSVLTHLTRGLAGAEARGRDHKRRKNRTNTKETGKSDAIEQQILARCASQVPACEAEIRRACDNGPACISLALPCCQSLTTCAFTTFFTCTDEVLSQL